MNRLFKIEFQKLWKNRSSKVLTLTYFILLTLISLIANVEFNFGPFHLNFIEQGLFNFPYIWHFTTYIADFFKLFLAVIIVSMMANEYSYGTLKQNLIDGMSKKEFIISKFITVVFFAGISTLFVFAVSLILGLTYSTHTAFSDIFVEIEYLIAYFIKLTCFFSFCLFLGILVKRSAFALGFLFFWYLFEGISFGIIKYSILHKKMEDISFIDHFYNLLPLNAMANLIVEPFSKLDLAITIGSQIGIENTKDYAVHFTTILIVIVWIVIFNFASYYIVKKRDL
ncbi:ABC transporter permease [uncultured Flavobacterium sp.]|uniref:ABC transporter permease n=1 Tax=uncultured Flavobacterium sp. TaxID=165435 RepID=UPI0030CA5702|tara:strand:+ start:74 stop:922 length:849 start_codon:yes stop_codon:yes gene_type:complete